MSAVKKVEQEPKKYPRRQGVPTRKIPIGTPRISLKLTQEQVAERLGVTQGQISKIESSDDAIEVRTLRAYAEAIGATLEVCLTVDGLRMRVM
jgi:DNA-binding XRE family transcriptional regulator